MTRPSPAKKVPIQERSCAVGKFVGINAYQAQKSRLHARLVEGGYAVRATSHFFLARRTAAPAILVAHWFAPQEIDAGIGHCIMQELAPLGILESPQDYGELFGAIVCSLAPRNPFEALYLYGQNTMHRYWQLLATEQIRTATSSPIDVFSTLYRRVVELRVGRSFLDAGCSFGFLPLLIAKRFPSCSPIVGIDIQDESFGVASSLAAEHGLQQVQFKQVDLLSDAAMRLGSFETVTLLHVLEHFSEEQMYAVLRNLLPLVARRLIIAVPYEEGAAEAIYGHQQLFTREKLQDVGRWCVAQWGEGSVHYEDCADCLLLLDRKSDA